MVATSLLIASITACFDTHTNVGEAEHRVGLLSSPTVAWDGTAYVIGFVETVGTTGRVRIQQVDEAQRFVKDEIVLAEGVSNAPDALRIASSNVGTLVVWREEVDAHVRYAFIDTELNVVRQGSLSEDTNVSAEIAVSHGPLGFLTTVCLRAEEGSTARTIRSVSFSDEGVTKVRRTDEVQTTRFDERYDFVENAVGDDSYVVVWRNIDRNLQWLNASLMQRERLLNNEDGDYPSHEQISPTFSNGRWFFASSDYGVWEQSGPNPFGGFTSGLAPDDEVHLADYVSVAATCRGLVITRQDVYYAPIPDQPVLVDPRDGLIASVDYSDDAIFQSSVAFEGSVITPQVSLYADHDREHLTPSYIRSIGNGRSVAAVWVVADGLRLSVTPFDC